MKESTPALIVLYDRLGSVELRERVIFAYAQKRDDAAALDELMGIAGSEPDWDLRGKAIFWLGQVRDPRAVQFLAALINR
jgi:HEAT repeat protein